jgi:hypothetical protein
MKENRKISYCPVSKDLYLLVKDMLEPEQLQRVLVALCDDFFSLEEDIELKTKAEYQCYKRLFDYAEEKHCAWYNRHRNFIDNNPKKKKTQDPDPNKS